MSKFVSSKSSCSFDLQQFFSQSFAFYILFWTLFILFFTAFFLLSRKLNSFRSWDLIEWLAMVANKELKHTFSFPFHVFKITISNVEPNAKKFIDSANKNSKILLVLLLPSREKKNMKKANNNRTLIIITVKPWALFFFAQSIWN